MVQNSSGKSISVLLVEPQRHAGNWHYACQLAEALNTVGLRTGLVTVSPFERVEGINHLSLFTIGVEPNFEAPSLAFSRVFHHVDRLCRLFTLVSRFRPDIVHLQGPIGALDFLYFRLLRRFGARIVYTAFEPRVFEKPIGWIDRARLRGADVVLVHSSSGVDDLVVCGVERSRIHQIIHGNFVRFCRAEGKSSRQARVALGLPDCCRAILFFGAVSRRKGIDLLIEAFATLAGDFPDARLIIAGDVLEDFSSYQDRIRAHGLNDRVVLDLRYIPFEDFWKYFLAADVVVLPYRHTYGSGVLQLAYGFGRPVVATAVGGVGITIQQDGTGIVASPEPSAIASAIRRLLVSTRDAWEMGQRARMLAETKYSWTQVAHSVVAIYKSLCLDSREPSAP